MITKFIIYNDSIFKSRVVVSLIPPKLGIFFFFFLSRNEMETDQHL